MRVKDPRRTVEYVLKEHQELPVEERPVFEIQDSMTAEQWETVQAAANQRLYRGENGEVSVGMVEASIYIAAAVECTKGWRNLENEDGSPMAFDRMKIRDRLPHDWVAELGQRIAAGQEVEPDEAKNSSSPPEQD
ncbi:MAG: hypothetical protein DHS20C21_18620 [Gemmatimonadota bacterium]|nr:MAG: hypothetical protein DHS20C21_18620 [Gemmatimonadota bacterium]